MEILLPQEPRSDVAELQPLEDDLEMRDEADDLADNGDDEDDDSVALEPTEREV